ncbi:MAG: hypothetical protein GWP08_19570 [Nitrospiraceae bacterium]|nr:hypothetical protein [Nitrospiraceae bacterium]
MAHSDPRDLDSAIDSALRGETLRAAPSGFCQAIGARLAIVGLIREERQRFRIAAGACGAALMAVAAPGLIVSAFPETLTRYLSDVPGAMGFFDYLLSSPGLSWPRVLGFAMAVLTLPVAIVLLSALLPPRKSAD